MPVGIRIGGSHQKQTADDKNERNSEDGGNCRREPPAVDIVGAHGVDTPHERECQECQAVLAKEYGHWAPFYYRRVGIAKELQDDTNGEKANDRHRNLKYRHYRRCLMHILSTAKRIAIYPSAGMQTDRSCVELFRFVARGGGAE